MPSSSAWFTLNQIDRVQTTYSWGMSLNFHNFGLITFVEPQLLMLRFGMFPVIWQLRYDLVAVRVGRRLSRVYSIIGRS
jgi:hypothetical protein